MEVHYVPPLQGNEHESEYGSLVGGTRHAHACISF